MRYRHLAYTFVGALKGSTAMIVRRIGVLSCAKVLGALYAALGLIFGAIITLMSLMGAAMGAALSDGSGVGAGLFGMLLGVGAIIALPIFYGLLGFISGALMAWFYNLAAKFTGGIALDLA